LHKLNSISKFEKLKEWILAEPKEFIYDELKTLLTGMGYVESNKGKTSGLRVAFLNPEPHIFYAFINHIQEILSSNMHCG